MDWPVLLVLCGCGVGALVGVVVTFGVGVAWILGVFRRSLL